MFGLISGLFSTLVSLVFPVLASYKALASNDITLTRPWLMYWIVLALCLSTEAFLKPLTGLVPFYGPIRFAVLVWLVSPQSQGAVFLYTNYLEPWLVKHDSDIDNVISGLYSRIKNGSFGYLNSVLGTSFGASANSANSKDANSDTQYAQGASQAVDSLFSRFRIPVPQEYRLAALVSGWTTTAPRSQQEYLEQRSKLMALVTSLDKARAEHEEYDIVPEASSPPRKGWLW